MPITTSMNTFIARAGGKIETPKLPNDLIINIIKLADGGKTTHKQKMSLVLDELNQIDENGNNCNEWCYGCDCMGFHWLCGEIEEHYENNTNPYIELMYFEPSDAILPPFMIELSKAFFEKNYDLTM